MENEDIPNLEDALSSLAEEVLEDESNLNQIKSETHQKTKGTVESAKKATSKIDSLRSQERTFLRIDRLLISGGIRFVLFLPLIVVVNFGL
ncbi:MAG: hypothetical protein VYA45_01730, partial [Candidatus Thermoplasmatota archaeon]|nr:hypothetical protein [Candidatus Thermoplasmatota archaeon]